MAIDLTKLPARELKTEDNLHYVQFGGQKDFVLANKGLTNWEEALNPNVEDGTQFIGEKTAQSTLMGYAPTVTYDGSAYPNDPFNYFLYTCGKLRKVGEKFVEVEVETWNSVDDTGTKFYAYKHEWEIQPDNSGSGEGGGKLAITGTFAQQGDVVQGTFDIKTKTFEETTA